MEKRRKIWKHLALFNEECYFLGAILFIIGSVLADIGPQYQLATSAFFVAGSVAYLVGASVKLVVDSWALGLRRKNKKKSPLPERLNVIANTFFTAGGILFTIGASFFVNPAMEWTIRAEIVWDVGSALFLFGAIARYTSDQITLSQLYKDQKMDGDPAAVKKHRSKTWNNAIGSVWYLVGTILFATGSAVFIFNEPRMLRLGNTLWILGSVCFMIGSAIKFKAELQ